MDADAFTLKGNKKYSKELKSSETRGHKIMAQERKTHLKNELKSYSPASHMAIITLKQRKDI